MAFINIIFFFPDAPGPSVPDMNYCKWLLLCVGCQTNHVPTAVVVLGGCILLSLAWYYFPVYGGVHWFKGPVRNVDQETNPPTIQGSSVDGDEKKGKDDASDEVVDVQ